MNRKKIAKTLIGLRGALTREYVAQSIGISLSALTMYENGKRIPKDEIKIKLARFYGKGVGEIFFS